MIIDSIGFTVTAPGAAGAAAVAVTGDSPFVRSGPEEISGRLLGLWTYSQGSGFTQVLFTYGHDMTRNIRYRHTNANPVNALGMGARQMMKAQDLISITQAGSATAGDVELITAQIAYPDLAGGNDKFIDSKTLEERIEDVVTIEDTVTGTVASTWSGPRALNAVTTSLKANRDYAILGGFVGIVCGAISIRGQDTGNLRCAIPGQAGVFAQPRDYFVNLAREHQMPLIPVVNAANQSGTFVEVLQNENLAAVPFSLMLALLKP